jgi:tetratricopeptide (TPR) repeat protein
VTGPTTDELARAMERGDHALAIELSDEMLRARPGNDAAHEYRARALLALGRLEEAERHASDAVRLDPDEIRYRELLAEILARRGAHRDAAAEFGRLARNDPRQPDWTVSEARERLDAAQPAMSIDAARRAVRLDPANARAQTVLSVALARTGDAPGALQAARRAVALEPGDVGAREAWADALWLADRDADAFVALRELAAELDGPDRARIVGKARALYRQNSGGLGRLLAAVGPAFEAAFARGWLEVGTTRR